MRHEEVGTGSNNEFEEFRENVEQVVRHLVQYGDAGSTIRPDGLTLGISNRDERIKYRSKANLKDMNLGGAMFTGSYLRCADLSGSNLRLARLARAQPAKASLTGANLSDCRLQGGSVTPKHNFQGHVWALRRVSERRGGADGSSVEQRCRK
ncbi:MAG: hypothetical protein AVDCRST_MAG93-2169 [uncultured Chloroflexia bacterium]|uniref:Pentapeptide repeat family protein n=1 Tax=uncultured Chloroflexia bacterium TaxID=1672391 RepID=A0A6J4IV01_9CHLR|nr:MAG: hypothetical protein AVDCRST_MAG93-2169 [uncultured Chloroflexia bacterium]